MSTTKSKSCPHCGGQIPAEAPQGLCPKCLLQQASFVTESGTGSLSRNVPPTLTDLSVAFPHLEILELIGQGGMGFVYKARQPKLDRFVALKILPQSLAGDPEFAERFAREARVLARLNHPNIVTIFDFGQANGLFYLLMEFVDGVNLRQAMKVGRFTPAQALAIVPKICEALNFAHNEGILHRDIKPENILLDTKGRVKIADFGIAKLLADSEKLHGDIADQGRRDQVHLTETGKALGTPHYMAPEQLEHPNQVDQRADIYSLGVVFYEMLTGELPIGRFTPPSGKTPVDPRVDEVVLRALEKEREKRFRTAEEVKTRVESIAGSAESGGSSSQASEKEQGSEVIKSAKCYVTTPEYLRTFRGRFLFIYQGSGELRLDADALRFSSGWQSVTIPLKGIRRLCCGDYPVSAKPIPLSYIGVTFNENGVDRTLLFTPARSGFSPVWETNKVLAEWLEALQDACRRKTGTAVPVAHLNELGIGSWQNWSKLFFVTALFSSAGAWLGMLVVGRQIPALSIPLVVGPVCAAVVVGIQILLRMWQLDRAAKDIAESAVSGQAGTATRPNDTRVESEPKTVCYFSTPERMRNCFPSAAAQVFICKGELRLDADALVFHSPWQTRLVIPFRDIEKLSVGQFQMWTTPWIMQYARVNFLAILFNQGGASKTVYLTPVSAGTNSSQQINEQVSEWFERIRKAVGVATGAVPESGGETVKASAEPAWNKKGLPLLIGLLATFAFAVAGNSWLRGAKSEPITITVMILLWLLLAALIWFSVGFLKANYAIDHGNLDPVTANEPPDFAQLPHASNTVR